jgi:hypothetical protein
VGIKAQATAAMAKKVIHKTFKDPAYGIRDHEKIQLAVFRRGRNEIKN